MTKTPPPVPVPPSSRNRFPRVFLGLLILSIGVAVAAIAFITKPKAEKESNAKDPDLVQVVAAEATSIQVTLPSQGLIEPRMKTVVAAEVGGKVISTAIAADVGGKVISPAFEAGQEFSEDEILVTIDKTDYETALAQAEAAVAEAILVRDTELARKEQAQRDWDRLGKKGEEPTKLTLRVQNVESAEARLAAAEASRKKAEEDLKRTEIRAPFPGRIASISTEKGAYLLPGAPVAEIYTTAPYEVRLPLSLDDWTFIQRDENGKPAGNVIITVDAGGIEQSVTGRIVRSEGQVDRESRSIYVVAEIGGDGSNPVDSLIQPGLFVKAEVAGKILENVIAVPVRSFRNLEQVMVVGDDKMIQFRKVKVLRRLNDRDEVLVKAGRNRDGGIEAGDWLCLTELADVIDGKTEVTTEEVKTPDPTLTGELSTKP